MSDRLLSLEFCESLERQVIMLNELYQQKMAAVKNAPEGHLRVFQQGPNRIPRFYRVSEKYSNGTYLDEKHFGEACKLAQKGYDEKILSAISKIYGTMNLLYAKVQEIDLDGIYEGLVDGRRNVVNPFRKSLSDFIEHWERAKYEGKPIDDEDAKIQTSSGITVRSKSEMNIADTLSFMQIPFHYEKPLKIRGLGVVYPDFICLNKRTGKEFLWEHLGMMGQEEYASKAVSRINHFQNSGYYLGDNLICTMETKSLPLNSSTVKKIAEHYLI